MRVEFVSKSTGGFCIFTDNSINCGIKDNAPSICWSKTILYKDITHIEYSKSWLGALMRIENWPWLSFPKRDAERLKQSIEYAKQKIEEAKQEQEKHIAMIKDGAWAFPVRTLYKKCLESGVSTIDSNFATQKALIVARQIMVDEGIPEKFHSVYVDVEKVKDLFERGKENQTLIDQQQEIMRHKPQKSKLSEPEMQAISFSKRVQALCGIDKRIAIIDLAIGKINKKIDDYERGQKAMQELAFLIGSSVAQEKKKDWAFLGGLAEGIAGPGAGAAVAADAMIRNQEIERRNQQARQAAAHTVKSIFDSSFELSQNIDDLKNEKKLMEYHRREAQTKVVLDSYTAEEIFAALKITESISKRENGAGLKLTVKIKNNFKADVPEGAKVAVDGTLTAEIYSGNMRVDTVVVTLPLFGVTDTEEMTIFSEYFIEADTKYTVKVKPNNLWIMEV